MSRRFDLRGKVVVVTGAASGIGRALADALADEGARLVLVDWNAEALEAARLALEARGTEVMASSFSVAERAGWEALREAALARFGAVDGVVNNAGIAHEAVAIEHVEPELFARVMDVNFWGTFHGTQVFLSDLVARPQAFVANVSSIFGIAATGLQSAYCTSKFAVRGFTETLRMEARAYYPNLAVHVVHPGGIATSITDNSIAAGARTAEERADDMAKFSQGLVTSPEKAAVTIVTGLKRGREKILIGTDARVSDWLVRLRPVGYSGLVLKQFRKLGLIEDRPSVPLAKREGAKPVQAAD